MNVTTITGCALSAMVSALLAASPARGTTPPDGVAKATPSGATRSTNPAVRRVTHWISRGSGPRIAECSTVSRAPCRDSITRTPSSSPASAGPRPTSTAGSRIRRPSYLDRRWDTRLRIQLIGRTSSPSSQVLLLVEHMHVSAKHCRRPFVPQRTLVRFRAMRGESPARAVFTRRSSDPRASRCPLQSARAGSCQEAPLRN